MEDEYGMGDLRQYIDGRPLFPAISQPPDLLSCHRSSYPYDMLVFRPSDSTAATAVGFEAEPGGMAGCGDGGAGRWPRQETLTLLEIRSRLDPKFKEANQKSPLWDEVSRILSQEYGYQRSGKKCREKFENLYKYYKKTKDGKAGRQDGKHYRFFRQLEAIYGDAAAAANNSSAATAHFHGAANVLYNYPNSNDQDSCDCDTTSSYCTDSNVGGGGAAADDDDDARMRKRRGKMRRKIEASIEAQMRSMMEKQEAWMERMARAIKEKEQERLLREEQWRRQDAARIDGEHKMWEAERAWIEARNNALMDAFNRLAGRGLEPPPPPPTLRRDCGGGGVWPESEVTRPIQLRSGMDLRFQENGMSEEAAWDEIAAKMAACGGHRSGAMCMEKWDHVIGDYLIKCSKKRKEGNAKGGAYSYDQNRDHPVSDHGAAGGGNAVRLHGGSAAAAAANDGLFRYFMGDSYQRL